MEDRSAAAAEEGEGERGEEEEEDWGEGRVLDLRRAVGAIGVVGESAEDVGSFFNEDERLGECNVAVISSEERTAAAGALHS